MKIRLLSYFKRHENTSVFWLYQRLNDLAVVICCYLHISIFENFSTLRLVENKGEMKFAILILFHNRKCLLWNSLLVVYVRGTLLC